MELVDDTEHTRRKTDNLFHLTPFDLSLHVTNEGDESLVWEFTMDVDGEITTLWNAQSAPAGDKLLFTGVDWNSVLDPGESAQFGFCAAF